MREAAGKDPALFHLVVKYDQGSKTGLASSKAMNSALWYVSFAAATGL